MAALAMAVGIQVMWERLPGRLKVLPLVFPLLVLLMGWRSNDRSHYRIAEDFSRTLLGTLPPMGIVCGP